MINFFRYDGPDPAKVEVTKAMNDRLERLVMSWADESPIYIGSAGIFLCGPSAIAGQRYKIKVPARKGRKE